MYHFALFYFTPHQISEMSIDSGRGTMAYAAETKSVKVRNGRNENSSQAFHSAKQNQQANRSAQPTSSSQQFHQNQRHFEGDGKQDPSVAASPCISVHSEADHRNPSSPPVRERDR